MSSPPDELHSDVNLNLTSYMAFYWDVRSNKNSQIVFDTIISSDDPEPVRRAIRDGFDVDKDGSWFLYLAIIRYRLKIVRAMLEASANNRNGLGNCGVLDKLIHAPLQSHHAWRSPVGVASAHFLHKEPRHKMVDCLLEHGASLEFDPKRHSESCAHAALAYADCVWCAPGRI
ncbi:hypothetical protein QAD02_024129 [Eretmocerus hayati]|uniref:Uncharacterized protein n=1 Tax=Eretmocerus hayati TaxID=131215 RepID=A0ACC2PYJ5_9HYME|nr:hypothetical protein QAD02_024129 [Eretmocerus hayati]